MPESSAPLWLFLYISMRPAYWMGLLHMYTGTRSSAACAKRPLCSGPKLAKSDVSLHNEYVTARLFSSN